MNIKAISLSKTSQRGFNTDFLKSLSSVLVASTKKVALSLNALLRTLFRIAETVTKITRTPVLYLIDKVNLRQGEKDISSFSADKSGSPRKKNTIFSTSNIKFAGTLLLVFLISFFGLRVIRGISFGGSSDVRKEVKGAKATFDVAREFTFPLKNDAGEEISSVKFSLEKAELRDEIVVQGQKYTAVRGRTFLIINIKIKNEYEKSIEMDTRDYLRLSVNGNEEEWLAPDYHNDPVVVQAISTKYTRVGFPLDDSNKDLVLRVGEINGDKEKIELDLR